MEHPDFVDNRDGNTLTRALNAVLAPAEPAGADGKAGRPPDAARIATAFFNPSGFAEIAERLREIPEVRLMLGADIATTKPDDRRRLNEDEPMFERRRLQAGLRTMDGTLRFERDRMPFNRTSGRALRALIEALRAGNMEVRRYEKTFLHAKAYIFTLDGDANTEGDGILVGSSNLTKAGLTGNLELNLGRYERPVVERARQWFDELWDEAAPYDLSEIFEAVFWPRTPWEIFLRVLYQLYGDEIEEDAKVDDNLPLTSFQKHGVARALRLIRDTGGGRSSPTKSDSARHSWRASCFRCIASGASGRCSSAPRNCATPHGASSSRDFNSSSSASPTKSLRTTVSSGTPCARTRTRRSCNVRWTSTSSLSWTKPTTAETPTLRPAQACCDACCSGAGATSCC